MIAKCRAARGWVVGLIWLVLSLAGSSAIAASGLAGKMEAFGLAHFGQEIEAPDFTLTGTNGAKLRLSDFRGRLVLINFWATW